MRTVLIRVRRFLGIWRSSGSPGLALAAWRNRSQQPVLEFLESGGRITKSDVEYRDLRLPLALFAGRDLAGVAYIRRLIDFGGRIEPAGGSFVATLPDGVRFEAAASNLVDTVLMMIERFIDTEYAWIETAGRVVIDVGANIGDSVVYFAKRGAAFVYGFEPDATAYAAAVRNLAINGIENAKLTNAAVISAGDDGLSFAGILRTATAEHPDASIACKIDCEGCEYDLFATGAIEPDDMRRVQQVMIEWHFRSGEPLRITLESLGFVVETSNTAPGVGWVRARRVP